MRKPMNELVDKFIKDYKSGQLRTTHFLIIFLHCFTGLFFWASYKTRAIPIDTLKEIISSYNFLLPIVLIGLFFRKLRNVKFYLIWLVIGLVQLIIYQLAVDNPDFTFPRGTAFDGLVALLPTLIMFQLMRQIFYSIKRKEMIISIRQFRMTFYEEEDKRNMTWTEVLFSILLMLTAIFSGTIFLNP